MKSLAMAFFLIPAMAVAQTQQQADVALADANFAKGACDALYVFINQRENDALYWQGQCATVAEEIANNENAYYLYSQASDSFFAAIENEEYGDTWYSSGQNAMLYANFFYGESRWGDCVQAAESATTNYGNALEKYDDALDGYNDAAIKWEIVYNLVTD
ncbi:MAG: hypothetical protein L0211_19295 [Planctomycetaceae bacterium]|nr:hypothetical protein [Planctomycetaceae bacterium]